MFRREGVGPVPAIQGGMGDQRAQPAAEGQRSNNDQHCEHRAGHCRPYRHGGPAMPRFEREADTGDRGDRRTGTRRHTRQARTARRMCPFLVASPAWRLPAGERDGGGPDAADQGEQPEAEHRGVNRDPGGGIDRAHRADRRKGRERDRHAGREQRPEDDGAKNAEQPVAHRHHRAGAKRAKHPKIGVSGLQLPRDHLHRDQQRRGQGDDAEHRQGDGLRFHGAVDLPLYDRGDVKAVSSAGRKCPDDLPLHRRDSARAITEPEPEQLSVSSRAAATLFATQPVPRSRAERPRERRGEQQERRETVDLVEHHLVVEHDGPGQPHVQPTARPDFRRAEGGLACLRAGIEAHRDHLPDVPAEQPFRLRGRDKLARASRIGHPARRHGDPVLTEVQPVDAADALNFAGPVRGRENRSTRSSQRERVDRLRCGLDPLHAGQPFQLPGQAGCEHGQAQAQVGGIGAGEERGERGLGPPRRGDRAHRDPAGQPDQQHNRQIAAPPAAEGSRKAIPRDPHDLSAHGTVRPPAAGFCRAHQSGQLPDP